MNIVFKTNLDWYRGISWPVLDVVPRKGEEVYVHPGSEGFCRHNKIPSRLEVVQVRYYYDRIEVELWYTKIDTDSANLVKGGLDHLYKQ